LLVSGATDSRIIWAAVIAETDGVLCRDGDPEELAEVVGRVAAGEKRFPYLQPNEVLECWIAWTTPTGPSWRCCSRKPTPTTSPARWG
jgi:hypothetical protein